MKKKIISLAVLIVFAILSYVFLRGHINELNRILEVNLKYVLILLFLRLFKPFFGGLKLKVLLKLYNINLKFKEWFGLTAVIVFGNSLTPFRAGFSGMAVYLKKKYHLPYTSSVGFTGIFYLIQFFTFGFFGVLFTLLMPIQKEFKYGIILIFAITWFISILLLFLMPLPIRINLKILKHVANAVNEFKRARNLPFILKMALLDTLRMIVLAFSFYLAFKAFDFNASFSACILLVVVSESALLINLLPMGIGIRDLSIILISKLIGGGILTGVFVTALDRAVGIVITFILGPIFSYLLFKKQKNE